MRAYSSRCRRALLVALCVVSTAALAQQPGPTSEPALPAPTVTIEWEGDLNADPFDEYDFSHVPHGRLRDRVLFSFVDVGRLDGREGAARADFGAWKRAYQELSLSDGRKRGKDKRVKDHGKTSARELPSLDVLRGRAGELRERGVVGLGLLHVPYARLRPDAFERGLVEVKKGKVKRARGATGSPYEEGMAFAVAPFADRVYGPHVRFTFDPALYQSEKGKRPDRLQVDLGDGVGLQEVRLGEVVGATYATEGEKEIAVVATYKKDDLHAYATLVVGGLDTAVASEAGRGPEGASGSVENLRTAGTERGLSALGMTSGSGAWDQYDSRWSGRSDRTYEGGYGYYDAYTYLGAGNTQIRRPVVIFEAFDEKAWDAPGNRRTLQKFYDHANRQDFIGRLRGAGHDVVLFKISDTGDYIQRNAFALQHYLERLKRDVPAAERAVVVGPSMGGLVARYALAHMEQRGVDHKVRLVVSWDTPHRGANVPIGVQHMADEFDVWDSSSDEAARMLNLTSARQMLVYHHSTWTEYPFDTITGLWNTEARPHPLRVEFVDELRALGYPRRYGIRNVALANGSGFGRSQRGGERVGHRRMRPGDQLTEYHWDGFWSDIAGNTWAVPDGSPRTKVAEARFKGTIFFTFASRTVYVEGSLPYDGAPGGLDGSVGKIEGSKIAGYMYVNFPETAFIPTVSALDLPTNDLFYHVANDLRGFTTTISGGTERTAVFDDIFYPVNNEVHIFGTTPEGVRFVLHDVDPSQFSRPAKSVEPLRVSIAGPSVVPVGQTGTWTAIVGGGAGGYAYRWYRNGIDTGATSQSYSTGVSHDFDLEVRVTSGGEVMTVSKYVAGYGNGGCDPDLVLCPAPDPGLPLLATVPDAYALHAPAPNPTAGTATLRYDLPEGATVRLAAYDLLGREVVLIEDGHRPAGYHRAEIGVRDLSPGVYVLRLTAGTFAATHRVTVVR